MSSRGHKSKLNAKAKRLIKRYDTGTRKVVKGGRDKGSS